jgi:serine/threonine protein kinase
MDDNEKASSCVQDETYVFVKFLGQGSFGRVNLYRNTSDNSLVVWKEINLKRLDAKARSEAFSEVEILSMLDHANIITYYKHFISDDTLYIELQYAKSGNLAQMIKKQKEQQLYFDEPAALWLIYQLARAVDYIHDIKLMHRYSNYVNVHADIACLYCSRYFAGTSKR